MFLWLFPALEQIRSQNLIPFVILRDGEIIAHLVEFDPVHEFLAFRHQALQRTYRIRIFVSAIQAHELVASRLHACVRATRWRNYVGSIETGPSAAEFATRFQALIVPGKRLTGMLRKNLLRCEHPVQRRRESSIHTHLQDRLDNFLLRQADIQGGSDMYLELRRRVA